MYTRSNTWIHYICIGFTVYIGTIQYASERYITWIKALRPSDSCTRQLNGSSCFRYWLAPVWRQAITWPMLTNSQLNPNENFVMKCFLNLSIQEKHLNMSSAIWSPFRLGFNVLIMRLVWVVFSSSSSYISCHYVCITLRNNRVTLTGMRY